MSVLLFAQEPSSIQLAFAGLATIGAYVAVAKGAGRRRKRARSATIDWTVTDEEQVTSTPLIRET